MNYWRSRLETADILAMVDANIQSEPTPFEWLPLTILSPSQLASVELEMTKAADKNTEIRELCEKSLTRQKEKEHIEVVTRVTNEAQRKATEKQIEKDTKDMLKADSKEAKAQKKKEDKEAKDQKKKDDNAAKAKLKADKKEADRHAKAAKKQQGQGRQRGLQETNDEGGGGEVEGDEGKNMNDSEEDEEEEEEGEENDEKDEMEEELDGHIEDAGKETKGQGNGEAMMENYPWEEIGKETAREPLKRVRKSSKTSRRNNLHEKDQLQDNDTSFEQVPEKVAATTGTAMARFGSKQRGEDFTTEAFEFGLLVKDKLVTFARQLEKDKAIAPSANSLRRRALDSSTDLSALTQYILSEFNNAFYKSDLHYLSDLFAVSLAEPVPPLSLSNPKVREKYLTSFAEQIFTKLSAFPLPFSQTLSVLFVKE